MKRRNVRTLLSRLLVSDAHLADINWRTAFDNCMRSREKQVTSVHQRTLPPSLAVLDPDSEEYAALLQQADALRTRKSKL